MSRPEESTLRLGRVYDPPGDGSGLRLLVDRLWPRGLTKARAGLDGWVKNVAPSPELRRWFAHDPQRFDVFRVSYLSELDRNPDAAALARRLRQLGPAQTVTLLTACRDPQQSHAAVLRGWLLARAAEPSAPQPADEHGGI